MLCAGASSPISPARGDVRNPEAAQALRRLAERYFEERLDYQPSLATAVGLHDRDRLLEDYSKPRVERERVALHAFLDTLTSAVDSAALALDDQVDYALLIRDARMRLYEIETLRVYERDPDLYHETASDGIYLLLKRDFAPLEERLEAVIARSERVPPLLATGMRNLKNPPEIWTRIAIEQARGTVAFFEKVVPAAASGVRDEQLRRRVVHAAESARRAARDYVRFLEKELLPRSKGEFALGRDIFVRRCALEEGITEPPESILARGLAAIEENHRQIAKVCRQIDPDASVAQVIERTSANHPTAARLVADCESELKSLRGFIVERGIVPIPGGENLVVTQTPIFRRSLSFASMDTPGPFEKTGTRAFYYVTPVDSTWSPTEQDDYLKMFCRGLIYTTGSHEAYPGHYVQGLYAREHPSLVRKLTGSYAFSEGWAHYCEQMLLDEGYSDDPELRLYQLHDALLRLCRLVLTIRMHTQGWSMEQAIDWIVREGYQERINAEREVKRYTMDPLVLSYTWGKWQIQELREKYRAHVGASYRLGEFHRRLLSLGAPPMALAERLLLSEGP